MGGYFGKTWSRGTNSGVKVTHKKWWIKWHKIIWKKLRDWSSNLREMQREEWKMKKTKSIFRPHACIKCEKAKLFFPLNVVCTFPPLSRCLFFCMVFYWKAHFSKPLSAEDFNLIKRGTLNVCMGHRFYQGAKKLSKSWEVVWRDGHFAFKNILYGICKKVCSRHFAMSDFFFWERVAWFLFLFFLEELYQTPWSVFKIWYSNTSKEYFKTHLLMFGWKIKKKHSSNYDQM